MDTKSLVYSRNVVEFATVAKEYCAFVEAPTRHTRETFVHAMQKLLPLLYYKASLLPKTEPVYDERNEKFVTEEDYIQVKERILNLLKKHDDFFEVHPPTNAADEGTSSASLSEYLADIYQDLKDFTMLYIEGNVDVMHDAVWECRLNFEEYWGIRTLNATRALHHLAFSGIDLNETEEEETDEQSEADTKDWFITRRQNDLRNDL